jgi:hypothetical protein
MVINPVALLIGLVVFALIFMVARWAIAELAVPEPIGKVVLVLLVLCFLLWLISSLGLFGSFTTFRVGTVELLELGMPA